MGVRAIGARTDSGGGAVTDINAEEDRYANIFVAEGFISPANAFEPVPATGFDIDIGSGVTDEDYYVVEGQGVGQGNYVVRLNQAGDTVTVSAADLSNDRLDAIYLVVMDNAYDASGLTLPRLAVRQGDPGPSPALPGPDSAWLAYAIIGTVLVPAAAVDITECTVTDVRIQSQSNVDAPTLEGFTAAAFATAAHDHDATYAALSHTGSGTGHPDAGGSDGMLTAADKAKLNAIEDGAEDNLIATEAIVLVKQVDGSGSGLDADLLDGAEGSTFSTSGHTHDGSYYTESELNSLLSPKAYAAESVGTRRSNTVLTAGGFETSPIFNVDDWDDWGGHPLNTGYIDDGLAGYYLVQAQVTWGASTGGTMRQIRLYHNEDGNVAFGREAPILSSGEATITVAETVVYMDGNDRITMFIYQDSGGNLAYSYPHTWLRLTYLG
jgi:hypothetical protein